MTTENHGFEAFERRARAAFEAGADALDATTLARLQAARQRAVAAATGTAPSRGTRWGWIAGTLAASVLAAALLLRLPGGMAPEPGAVAADPATAGREPLEMLAAGEEFEIATADEDLEFYEWIGAAPTDSSNGQG